MSRNYKPTARDFQRSGVEALQNPEALLARRRRAAAPAAPAALSGIRLVEPSADLPADVSLEQQISAAAHEWRGAEQG